MVSIGFKNSDQQNPKTKCTKSKMSEESDFKRNGIIGVIAHDLSNKFHKNYNQYEEILQQKLTTPTSSNSGKAAEHGDQSSNKFSNSSSGAIGRIAGGRLQFFKDGKFILELASSREGERLGWVSVPRKTYWPPTISSNNSVSFQKHESSTSLSYSDDNSSIQSSPWQRDHCWKQSLPRRNISKEMALYFHRPSTLLPIDECLKFAKMKRRRPHDKKFQTHRVKKIAESDGTERSNNTQKLNENENSQPSEATGNVASTNPGPDDATATTNDKSKSSGKNRSTLTSIVKKLSEKNPTVISQNARMSQLSISNHHHVSPRKRILRELEKVSLEDITTMKRSRAKTTVMTNSIPSVSVAVAAATHIKSPSSSRNVNGNSTSEVTSLSPSIHQTSSRPISSYSITSLLGHNSESSKNSSNNNNYRKEQLVSATAASHQHNKDYEYNRNMKSSPKSPEQIPQKMYSSVAHISSGRKRSSPIYHPHSPSPISSDQSVNKQSPNLSSSPEQQQQNLNKYRQHPYNYNNSMHNMMNSPSVSSPNYTIPSRYSPSPNAENYSQKYRSTYLSSNSPSATYNNSFPGMNNSSPSHQLLIKRESPIATSSSPCAPPFSGGGSSSSNHRKSPPQNYTKFVDSPTHQANFHPHFSHYQAAKEKDRDLSPSMSPKKQDYPVKYEKYTTSTSTSSSSSQQSGSGRTVPKKNASLRHQQYDSPTESPSDMNASSSHEETYKNSNKLKHYNKIGSEPASMQKQHHYKMSDYESDARKDSIEHYVSSSSTSGSSGMNIESNSIIRPSLIPSLQQSHMSSTSPHPSHPSMYYMYNHPLHHPQSGLQAHIQAQQNSFLSPAAVPSYYHLYAAAAASAAAFRPLWPHYPGVPPSAQHHMMSSPNNSRIPGSLLNYSGANMGLMAHPNLTEPPNSWEQITARHSLSSNEVMRIKEEPNSDVPLNLSKH